MPTPAYELANDGQVAAITQMVVEFNIRVRDWTKAVDYNEVMVILGLSWGRASGKPLDATSLANILNMPRTTVKRILERLVATGEFDFEYQGRRKVFYRSAKSLKGLRGAEYELLFIEADRRIKRLGTLLSKMDGKAST